MRQRSRDGLRLHTAPSQNAAREQIHCLLYGKKRRPMFRGSYDDRQPIAASLPPKCATAPVAILTAISSRVESSSESLSGSPSLKVADQLGSPVLESEDDQDFSGAESDDDMARIRENLHQMNEKSDSENDIAPIRFAPLSSTNCGTILAEDVNEESTNPKASISGPTEHISYLSKHYILSLGTVNKNQLGKDLKIPSLKDLKDTKTERGYSEEWVADVDGSEVGTVMSVVHRHKEKRKATFATDGMIEKKKKKRAVTDRRAVDRGRLGWLKAVAKYGVTTMTAHSERRRAPTWKRAITQLCALALPAGFATPD
ncbi:hypothetical protein EVAR_103632_1 [Eumeta japonica]|uniref:Uncharacterized protein n=1 Tax=Eumeta variegata TaxID=151549 RepID=A0A4C1ZFW9_EUMVA|nr:hypothetical protein EVAR_103632_1 [Eumeta japonica]